MTGSEAATVYRRSPAVAVEDFGERSLVLHCTNLEVIELNATARDVLKLLDGQASPREVADSITERYDTTPETALQDIQAIIVEMENLNLVEPVAQDKG
jgi:hypothetical protein